MCCCMADVVLCVNSKSIYIVHNTEKNVQKQKHTTKLSDVLTTIGLQTSVFCIRVHSPLEYI